MRNATVNKQGKMDASTIARGVRLFGGFVIAFLCAFSAAFAQEKIAPEGKQLREDPQAQKIALKDKWGVEVTAIRLTSSDHMIDFRYKVYNAEKAASLFKREIKPQLIHAATGKVLSVPVPAKVGALRTTEPPQTGRTYWMLFGNGGNLVKKGNEVSVVIGDFRADKLIVE